MILGKQDCNGVHKSPALPAIGTTAPGVGYKTVLIYVYEAGTSHQCRPPWFLQCLQYKMLKTLQYARVQNVAICIMQYCKHECNLEIWQRWEGATGLSL